MALSSTPRHETAFLHWVRLRCAVEAALGSAPPSFTAKGFLADPSRPLLLVECDAACYGACVQSLRSQQMLTGGDKGGDGCTLTDAPHWLALESAWRLVPVFHTEWPLLWDLEMVDTELGSGPWTDAQVRGVFASRLQVARHENHHPKGQVGDAMAKQRCDRLLASAWIAGPAPYQLTAPGRDAATLLRFVVGPRISLPRDSFDRIRFGLGSRPNPTARK